MFKSIEGTMYRILYVYQKVKLEQKLKKSLPLSAVPLKRRHKKQMGLIFVMNVSIESVIRMHPAQKKQAKNWKAGVLIYYSHMSRPELSHSAGDIESFRCKRGAASQLDTPRGGSKNTLFWLRNSDARRHFCLKPMRTAGIFFVHYPDVKVCRGEEPARARKTKTIKSRRQRRFLLETLYAGWVSRLRLIERTLCKWGWRHRRAGHSAKSASSDF